MNDRFTLLGYPVTEVGTPGSVTSSWIGIDFGTPEEEYVCINVLDGEGNLLFSGTLGEARRLGWPIPASETTRSGEDA
jgi:hypothetical protein